MGIWHSIIGKDHDHDHDRGHDHDRDRGRGDAQPPPWKQQWEAWQGRQSPEWRQWWQQQPTEQQQLWWQQWYQQQQQLPWQSAPLQYPRQQPTPWQPAPSWYQEQPLAWQQQHPWPRPYRRHRHRGWQPGAVHPNVVAPRLGAEWQQIVGQDLQDQIPPRNALIQDPGPGRAGREVLPMSTGVAILPTQSAQITARPQRVAFRPERVFISAAGTSGGAADWVVNDIKIGNRSQFSQSGDVPGDMFATNAIDGFVSFETAQTAMDVVMVVTYIGLNESGVPFFASIVGTAAI